MLTTDTFLNRSAELQFLSSVSSLQVSEAKVVLLSAETGVGKSALVKEWARREDKLHLRAEVKEGEKAPGLYISKLSAAVNRLGTTTEKVVTLEKFMRSLLSSDSRSDHDRELLDRITETTIGRNFRPIGEMIKRRMPLSHSQINSLLHPGTDEGFWQLGDYLGYVLKSGQFIVSIENVHLLDPLSKEILMDLVSSDPGNTYVLEYTEKRDESNYLAEDLIEECKHHSSHVASRRIEWLPLRELISNGEFVNFEKLLESAYYKNEGNLRALKDLEILLLDRPQNEFFDISDSGPGTVQQTLRIEQEPTLALLDSLRKADLFLLVAMSCHSAEVSEPDLGVLYEYASYSEEFFFDVPSTVGRLLSIELIERQPDDKYQICHDSTLKALRSSEAFARLRQIAWSAWARYYEDLLTRSDFVNVSRSTVLLRLLGIYASYRPQGIVSLLDDIKEMALKSRYPKEIVKYVEKLHEDVGQERTNEAVHSLIHDKLIDIYYSSGLFDHAQVLSRKRQDSSFFGRLLDLALLDRLERHKDAIELTKELRILKPETNLQWRFNLCVDMIAMISLRALNRMPECREVYGKILNTPLYAELPEYGYFLRNAQIVLSIEQAIEVAIESAEFFARLGRRRDEAHSRISLAMFYIRVGRLTEGLRELDEANNRLESAFMERHIIVNNIAVAEVLSNKNNSANCLLRLKRALRTVSNSFDKIVLLNNMAVCACLNGRWGYADDVFEVLHGELREQPDKALLRTVLFNQSVSLDERGERTQAEKLKEAASKTLEEHEALWKARLFGDFSADNEQDQIFATILPYHLSMITYWHFDISEDFKRQS